VSIDRGNYGIVNVINGVGLPIPRNSVPFSLDMEATSLASARDEFAPKIRDELP
jgi:hypothetical protein